MIICSSAQGQNACHIVRVLLDGEDVTDLCWFADDQAGYVALYEVEERIPSASGGGGVIKYKIDPGRGCPVVCGKIGKVEILPRRSEDASLLDSLRD